MDRDGDSRGGTPVNAREQPQPKPRSGGLFGLLRSPFQAAAKSARRLASPREMPKGQGISTKEAVRDKMYIAEAAPLHEEGAMVVMPEKVVEPPVRMHENPVYGRSQTVDVSAQAPNQQEGWSPSKLESLNFFLARSDPAGSILANGNDGPSSSHNGCQACMAQQACGAHQRPYLGLKYLLRSGPTGPDAPKTWAKLHGPQGVQKPKELAKPGIPASARYAPYALPPSGMLVNSAKPQQQLQFHGHGPLPLTPYPHAQLRNAAAAGQLQGPTGMPRPQLALPHAAMRPPAPSLARSAAATPDASLRKLDRSGPRSQQQPIQQPSGTPMPRKLFQGPASGASTPMTGGMSAGLKRARGDGGSVAVTPLMGSGITNLAEYKRQRQRYSSESNTVLSMGAGGGGSGSAARSPSASASPDDLAAKHAEVLFLPEASTPVGRTPGSVTTDTARRILQTLDNMGQAMDQRITSQPSTPTGSTPGKGPAGSTPFPRFGAPPPPLDRLSPVQLASPSPALAPKPRFQVEHTVFAPLVPFTSTENHPDPDPSAQEGGLFASTRPAQPREVIASPTFGFSALPAPAADVITPTTVTRPAPASRVAAPGGHHVTFKEPETFRAPSKVFEFGSNGDDEVALAFSRALRSVPADQDVVVPRYTFGAVMEAARPVIQSTRESDVAANDVSSMMDKVAQASQVPLPDFSDGEEEPVQVQAEQLAKPDAVAKAAAEPPVASGWGSAFMASNQAALMSSSEAVAKEIEAAKSPAPPAASPAPAPVTDAGTGGGGWDMSFLAQNQSQLTAANEAVQKELADAMQATAAPAAVRFSFGTPSVPAAAVPSQLDAPSFSRQVPPSESATTAPAAAGGWGAAFLNQSQAAMTSASDAVAHEILAAQTPGATPAAAAAPSAVCFGTLNTPEYAFGSPFPPAKSVTPSPMLAAFMQEGTKAAEPVSFYFGARNPSEAGGEQPAPFTFGAASAASSQPAHSAPSFSFGAAPAPSHAAPAPAHAHAILGMSPIVAEPLQPTFGAPAPSASTGFTFGAPQQQQQATGTTSPMSSSAFGFSFGSAPAQQSQPSFAAPAPAPATSMPHSFGAAAAPSWSSPAPAFGSPFGQAPTPATASPGGSFAFTPAASAPMFSGGASAPAQASQPFTFGGTTPTFGATPASPAPNTFGQPGHTPFAFGQQSPSPQMGSPMQSFQLQQAQPAFAFGGGGGSAAPSFSAPNFGAPAAAAAPAGFSMGGMPSSESGGGGGFTMGAAEQPSQRRKVKAKRGGQ